MADHASDYSRGNMDIREHKATFALFMGMTKWGSLAIADLLVFITLWFCTKAGFMGAAVTAIVLLVLGVLALKEKKSAAAH